MPPKFSKSIRDMQDRFFNIGMITGLQMAGDSWGMACRDCGIPKAKIIEIAQLAMEYDQTFGGAIETKKNPEADVLQYKMDTKLKEIYGDLFAPFEERYQYIYGCKY